MKQSKCGECPLKFEGSTSEKVIHKQYEHWQATGHRRFIGIRGFGTRTYGILSKPAAAQPKVVEPVQPNTAVPHAGLSIADVEAIVETRLQARLALLTNVQGDVRELRKDLEFVEDEHIIIKEKFDRIERLLAGFAHDIVHGTNGHEDEEEEAEPEPEPIEVSPPLELPGPPTPALRMTKKADIPAIHAALHLRLKQGPIIRTTCDTVAENIGMSCTPAFVRDTLIKWAKEGSLVAEPHRTGKGGHPTVEYRLKHATIEGVVG